MSGFYWIASYPKSGNTWVRSVIAALLAGGELRDLVALREAVNASASRHWIEEVLDDDISDLIASELDVARAEAHWVDAETSAGLRCLKVHDRYDPTLFPPDITAGIIYVVRDPRDVAPSLAAHISASVDLAVDRLNSTGRRASAETDAWQPQSSQLVSSWSDHVLSWLDRSMSPLLLLRYEDMISAPLEQFRRLADFIGLGIDDETLRRAVDASRFEELKAREGATGFSERPPKMERFFRQGMAGNWQHELTSAQAERIVAVHREVMQRLGYL